MEKHFRYPTEVSGSMCFLKCVFSHSSCIYEIIRSPYHNDRNPALAAPAPVWFGSDGNVCGSAVWSHHETRMMTMIIRKKMMMMMMTKTPHTVASRSLSLASRVKRRFLTPRLETQINTSTRVKVRLIAAITVLYKCNCVLFRVFLNKSTGFWIHKRCEKMIDGISRLYSIRASNAITMTNESVENICSTKGH